MGLRWLCSSPFHQNLSPPSPPAHWNTHSLNSTESLENLISQLLPHQALCKPSGAEPNQALFLKHHCSKADHAGAGDKVTQKLRRGWGWGSL